MHVSTFQRNQNNIKMNEPGGKVMDKSLRSVFVGNIPYEATEEKLKDIFNEVGQVGKVNAISISQNHKSNNFSDFQARV